jgi:NitT/TauT family transport system substrate-binding protein
MKITPVGKAFILLVVVATIGTVAYKRYGGQHSVVASSQTPADDKSLFTKLGHGPDATPNAAINVTGAPVGAGKLNRPLVVAINTWAGHAPGIVANGGLDTLANSIYAKKGIKVAFKLVESPSDKLSAFTAGSVDVMWDTADSWAREAGILQEKGQASRAILQQDWSRGGDGIVSLKSIQSVEDLKGKRIATTQFTPSHWLLLDLLAESGLSKADKDAIEKNLVFTAEAPLAAAAFKAGQVDAAVTWEPDLTNSVNARPNDAHVLISTAAATQAIADVLVARQEVIDTAPQTLVAFVDGWFEGMATMDSNPQGATAVVSKALKLTPDDVTGMLSGLKLTKWADNAQFSA